MTDARVTNINRKQKRISTENDFIVVATGDNQQYLFEEVSNKHLRLREVEKPSMQPVAGNCIHNLNVIRRLLVDEHATVVQDADGDLVGRLDIDKHGMDEQ